MNIEVKPKTGLWKISRLLSEQTAHGIYPHVYLPEKLYADFISANPSPKALSIVHHEKKHIERQSEMGWLVWLLLYVLSSKFRLDEELIATSVEMKSLKIMGVEMDIENKAKMLSSWLYLKCVSFDQVKVILEEMWQSA